VPTKMGGPGAPDDFDKGYLTQTWLAVSDDPAAAGSGRYWHHRRPQAPAREVSDSRFQDELAARLAEWPGVSFFGRDWERRAEPLAARNRLKSCPPCRGL